MIPVVANGRPLVFAHRGGGEEVAENSLAAFNEMKKIGVRHIETDVHRTKDGKVVVHHDDVVDRTYDGTGRVEDLTWDEIRSMRNAAGERMPLLSEVLEEHPELWFNIDAKTDAVVDPMMEVLESHNAFDRVMLASFSERRLQRIRGMRRGRVSTSLGVSGVARLLGAAQSATSASWWRIPGPRMGVRAVQVPHRQGPLPIVTPRFIATAHTLGLAVHVWTINEAEEMRELIDMGVDGIITDRPSLAKEILIGADLWHEVPPANA